MRTVELQSRSQAAIDTCAHESSAPLEVRVVRSVPEIEQISEAWTRMQGHPNSDIDFFLTILGSRPGILRPHIIVVYRGADPVAILVGRLEDARFDLKVGYASFLRPRVRSLTFIYGGLLGNTGTEVCATLVQEIGKALRQGDADVAFFNHLRMDSPLYSSIAEQARPLTKDYFPALQTHRAMILPDSPDQFWQSLSAKVRKNQRWQAKKLLNDYDGDVQIRCFQKPDELERMMQDMELVAAKTYQRGLGVGFADTADLRTYLALKARKGWLRSYLLYLKGKPCAFWSGTLYRSTFHSDYMGYDPDYSKHSPGMYLIMNVVEEFCRRRTEPEMGAIDFGLGDAQYKEVLGNQQWQDVSGYIFAPTFRGIGLNALRTPVVLADRGARRALGKAGLVQKIKKFWRHGVTARND